jgi:hypothetical protein
MTKTLIHQLRNLEKNFEAAARWKPASVEPIRDVESVGGVYGIWEEDNLRYFGETCHLQHRIEEIVQKGRHHSLDLLIGPAAQGKTGAEKATWFCQAHFLLSWLVVEFGRSEFEEYMVLKHGRTLKNHRAGRFSLRSDYKAWLTLAEQPANLTLPLALIVAGAVPLSTLPPQAE